MSAADIDSPRLRSERERLFGPGEEGQVRALVLALARPADWEVLGRVWKGVQDELGWPAPGIAVSGTDACQLWFSLADPLPPAQAHALLERLRLRYLAEVPAHRVELIPSADGERQVPRIPAALGEEAWSAYVAPDLAPVFAETPWLDVPPRAEGQAELLSRLRSISAAECAVLLPEVDVGRGCKLRKVVVDNGCVIPPGMQIGFDAAEDARRFYRTDSGVVLVTKAMLMALE